MTNHTLEGADKIRRVSSGVIVGRTTAGEGRAELLTPSAARSLLAVQTAGEVAALYYNKTEVDSLLTAKANASHGHIISDISGLSSTLSGIQGDIVTLATTTVPRTTTLTINGTAQDLSANRSWTVGDVRSDASYSNPTWLTGLAWSKVSGTPSTLSGYGITDAVPVARTIATGTGLAGGGNLGTDRTISLANTTVSPGSYTLANITVDAQGRITAASNGSASGGITSLGGQTGTSQTFQAGSTGNDFSIDSSANVHTFNLPDASASARGLVTTGAQTFAGNKSFTGTTVVTNATGPTLNMSATAASVTTGINLIEQGTTYSRFYHVNAETHLMALFGGFYHAPSGHFFCSSVSNNTANGTINAGAGSFSGALSSSFAGTALSLTSTSGAIDIANRLVLNVNQVALRSNHVLSWSSSTTSTTPADVILQRFGSGSLAQYDGANPQAFSVFNTFATTTNFERGVLFWNSNQFRIATSVGSVGGTQRSTVIGTFNAAGTWFPILTINPGGSGTWTTQSQEVTFSGSSQLYVRTGSQAELCGSYLLSLVDSNATASHGQVKLELGGAAAVFSFLDTASNAADRVVAFGGRTSAFPALKRSGTTLQVRLADDSAAAPLSASRFFLGTDLGLHPVGSGASTAQSWWKLRLAGMTVTNPTAYSASNGLANNDAHVEAFATSASIPVLLVRGATSQTADLQRWQDVAGTTLLAVSSAGRVTGPALGSASATFAFGSGNTGLCFNSSVLFMALGGVEEAAFTSGIVTRDQIRFSTAPGSVGSDLTLIRDAANSLGIRNGTNAQTVGIYNTWAAANNFEELQFQWSTNVARIGTAVGAVGGTQRAMSLGVWNAAGAFTTALTVNTTGTVTIGAYTLPAADGTNGQVLQTNGAGAVSWATVSGGGGGGTPGGSNTQIQFNDAGAFGGSAALTLDKTTGQMTNAQGTLTASAPLTLTQSWNSGATTFTGSLINVTDTASASASLLQDWQVGGSSRVSLRKDGQMQFFGTGSGLGLAQLTGGGNWWIYSGGTMQSPLFNVNGWYGMVDGANGGLQFYSGHGIVWSGTGTSGSITRNSLTGDAGLFRDGAGCVGLRWSTTAQTFRVYNTFASTTNAEWYQESWVTNEARIGTAVGSAGGTQRNLVLGGWNSAGAWTPKITVNPAGHVTINTSGTWTFVNGGANAGLYTATNTAGGGKITFGDQSGILGSGSSGSNFYMDYNGWSGHRFGISADTAGPLPFLFTDGTFSALTAGTEMTSVNWNLSTTKTFAAGAIGTQRAFRIQAPTYSCATAMTITTASTLSISGAPAAAGSLTITTPYALNVESGNVFVGGTDLVFNGTWSLFSGSTEVIGYRAGGSYGLCMGSTIQFGWASGTNVNSAAIDVALVRDAAGTLGMREGLNAQTLRVYNTWSSTTNNEFLTVGWNANVAQIGTIKGSGGGSARDLVIQTDGVTRMTFSAGGTATVNTALVAGSTALINSGSQAFTTSFHVVSWNNGCFGWASTGTVTTASTADTAIKRASAGLVEINNGTAGTYRDLVVRNLRMSAPTVPATATSTGSEGQISWDSNFVYVCVATDSWKRAALSSW